jgi:hypothetical protein
MPNSRVQALTENASTLATPMTAIQQCDPGEHAKDQGIQAVWREHFCTDVFERGSVLNGFFGGHFADNFRHRRHQRIRICSGVDQEVTAVHGESSNVS